MATQPKAVNKITVQKDSLTNPLTERYRKSNQSTLRERNAEKQEVDFLRNRFAKGFVQRPILMDSEMVKANGHRKTLYNQGLDERRYIDFVGGPGSTAFGQLAARQF
jgi:hypothetical protein